MSLWLSGSATAVLPDVYLPTLLSAAENANRLQMGRQLASTADTLRLCELCCGLVQRPVLASPSTRAVEHPSAACYTSNTLETKYVAVAGCMLITH